MPSVHDYVTQESREAVLAKDADKLECIVQARAPRWAVRVGLDLRSPRRKRGGALLDLPERPENVRGNLVQ
jgi:hypothetical protein